MVKTPSQKMDETKKMTQKNIREGVKVNNNGLKPSFYKDFMKR